jgi:hypothetical protein
VCSRPCGRCKHKGNHGIGAQYVWWHCNAHHLASTTPCCCCQAPAAHHRHIASWPDEQCVALT